MIRPRLLAVVASLALLLAACGGDGDKVSSGGDAAKATTVTEAEKVDAAADKALAQKAVITAADVGPGYKETPASAESEAKSKAEDEEINTCVGPEATRIDAAQSAEVTGSDFAKDDGTAISSEADVYNSTAVAKDAMTLVRSDKIGTCFDQFLQKEFAKSAGEAKITTSGLKAQPFPKLGDDTAALQLTLSVEAGGQKAEATIDIVFARKGRLVLSALFARFGGPGVPAAERQSIVTKTLARA